MIYKTCWNVLDDFLDGCVNYDKREDYTTVWGYVTIK